MGHKNTDIISSKQHPKFCRITYKIRTKAELQKIVGGGRKEVTELLRGKEKFQRERSHKFSTPLSTHASSFYLPTYTSQSWNLAGSFLVLLLFLMVFINPELPWAEPTSSLNLLFSLGPLLVTVIYISQYCKSWLLINKFNSDCSWPFNLNIFLMLQKHTWQLYEA